MREAYRKTYMNRLKIVYVIDSLGRGGTERSLVEMLPQLIQAEVTPIIIYFSRYQDGVETEVKKLGIDARLFSGKGILARVQFLKGVIEKEQPDLVHTALFTSDLVGRLANLGRPHVVLSSLASTPYAPVRRNDPNLNRIGLKLFQAIDSFTASRWTTHFHAVSHSAKTAAVRDLRIHPEQITVVERGRNPARLGKPGFERRQQARRQLGFSDEDEVVVNVGRHEYAKGQRYLLVAMEQLTRIRPRLILLIVGREGAVSKELRSFAEQANLNGRVRFLGHRNDVPDILAAADLFAFPSLYEGLPGAVIEAMALALPIVASDIPPLREVVENGRNATLVPVASPSELTEAIADLLDDRNKSQAYGKRSIEIFEARFTLEKSVSRMMELYQKVAAMGKRRQPARQSSAYHVSALSMRVE